MVSMVNMVSTKKMDDDGIGDQKFLRIPIQHLR